MLAHASKRRRFCDESPIQVVFRAQITGVGITRLSQLHDDTLDDANERFDLENIPDLLSELDTFSVCYTYDDERCLDVLKEIYCKLTNFEARRQTRPEGEEDPHAKYARLLIELGGVEILTRLLMTTSVLPEKQKGSNQLPQSLDSSIDLRIKSMVLQILCRLISAKTGEELAKNFSDDDETLNYIFTLLGHDKTFLTACQFLEDMLQNRRSVLNLTTIPYLKELVMCMDDRKLANFCRVLAVTISDLDIYENKSSLFAQNKQKRSKGFINVRDINQELLLNIPDLVPRLINIAISKNSAAIADTPRYRGMSSELDCWMEWIENSMSDDAFDIPTRDDLDEFVGGISEPINTNSPLVQQSGLKISTELILRVQVVYVLGLFLVGKHRKKVQRKLAELQLVPGLSELFEQFIWKCQAHRNNTRHRLRGHNSSCECSPEVALKIQFLRLVHSFCDHSDYKHLLLSKSEWNEVKRINGKAGPLQIEGLDNVPKNLMCKGSKGLLSKIVEVMKKEPTASTFRFWLARAVESYLRGSTSFCDQVFLLRRGLLQHIAGNIVEHDIRPKEILQSSFDLLGELVKFNCEAFRAFDKVLNTKVKLEKFLTTVNKNLVDSNMFIRALVLSLEHFSSAQPEFKSYANTECDLLMYMAKFEQQIEYLRKLINLINVQNLTQENVSCLNTTLVFLMFANQKSQLPKYLDGLMRDKSGSSAPCNVMGASFMKNFRDLLVFWQDHYLHKDKDCSALERSSRISFDYWKQTVATLVVEDRNLTTAVYHYMDTDDNNAERDS